MYKNSSTQKLLICENQNNQSLVFIQEEFGTPNPKWTKEKGCNLNDLARHIVRRTPPQSYQHHNNVFVKIVQRNQKAIGNWAGGYLKLAHKVIELLCQRDGSL